MNGRMYDATLGRFLSPDNYIQDPFNTQSFNRYGYVWNNPLVNADPNGEFLISMLVGALISVAVNGIANTIKGEAFFKGAGKAALIGAIGGAVASAIGGATQALQGFQQFAARSVMHAYAGGFTSAFSGGNFWSGFASGFMGATVGGGTQSLLRNTNKFVRATATIASSGLVGGATSEMAGGEFWGGARNGLISASLNHVAHGIRQEIQQRVWKNKWFNSKKAAYQYATDKSFQLDKEVSGYSLENGECVVLDPSENIERSSRNDQIQTYKINGSKQHYVFKGGRYVKITGQFHTHPTIVNTSNNPIGVSVADLRVMNRLNTPITILHMSTEWQVTNGSDYSYDRYSFSLKNLGLW